METIYLNLMVTQLDRQNYPISATWTQTEICPKSFSIELQARAQLKPVLGMLLSSITPTHKQRAPAVKPASQDKGLAAPYLRRNTGFCLE